MNKPFSFLAKIGGKEAAIEINPFDIPADQIKEGVPLNVYTNMDVDSHDYDIRERRKILRTIGSFYNFTKKPKELNSP